MEVLIAVTLLSLLSVGMFQAMRIGLTAFAKADSKLMDNRRAAGAQRILQAELEGLVPAMALCGAGAAGSTGVPSRFFQGERQTLRLVSTYSLQQGWRGRPQILEVFVIPGENGRGVRLVVNEIPYTGAESAGRLCTGAVAADGLQQFLAVNPRPESFVLADKLAYCRFAYFGPPMRPEEPPAWKPDWKSPGWPQAVRIDMAPLDPDPSRVQPISVTAPIYIHRNPALRYIDNG